MQRNVQYAAIAYSGLGSQLAIMVQYAMQSKAYPGLAICIALQSMTLLWEAGKC